MTFDLFSSILSSGSSVSVPALGVKSEDGVESGGLGWDDSSVISGKMRKWTCFWSVLGLTASSLWPRPMRHQIQTWCNVFWWNSSWIYTFLLINRLETGTKHAAAKKGTRGIIINLKRTRAKRNVSPPDVLIHRNQTYSCPPTRVRLLLFRLVSLAFDQCLCYHSQKADLWGSRGLEGEPGFTHRCFLWMGPKLEWTRLFVCGTMACDSTVRHTGPQGTRADMKRRGSYREGEG